jgi:hypothetical protein
MFPLLKKKIIIYLLTEEKRKNGSFLLRETIAGAWGRQPPV